MPTTISAGVGEGERDNWALYHGPHLVKRIKILQ